MHPQAAAVLLAFALSGCASSPDPPADADDEGANLHAYISNQSFDQSTADIRVTVDGKVLFDGEAEVEDQHNWIPRNTKLDAGSHLIEALERTTGTEGTETFTLPEGEERWVVVDYWSSEGDDEGPYFSISVHEQQVAFD